MNSQTTRLWSYLVAHPNEDLPAPVLNKAAAGDGGVYVSSFTKRVSECRQLARSQGGDFIKSRDEWFGTSRRTWYRYLPPQGRS